MPTTRLQRTFRAVIAIVTLVLCGAGCGSKPTPPPVAYIGPTINGQAMGISEVPETPACGYTLLQETSTTGRFPCALAVARLTPAGDFYQPCNLGETGEGKWWIDTMPDFEATRWNGLCDTIAPIREVTVMGRRSVISPDADVNGIIASAHRINSGLCLIYGPAQAGPDHAAMQGVLMDTENASPIAFIHADAGPDDFEAKPTDRIKTDQRYHDVNYLVARRFEQNIRCCILDLIGRDQPPATTQPSPWNREDTAPRPVYVLPNQPVGFRNF